MDGWRDRQTFGVKMNVYESCVHALCPSQQFDNMKFQSGFIKASYENSSTFKDTATDIKDYKA